MALCKGLLAQDPEDWVISKNIEIKRNPIKRTTNSIFKGKTIFLNNCRSCHGQTGKGDGVIAQYLGKKVPNFFEPDMLKHLNEISDGELFFRISTGNNPMPGFVGALDVEERWHVINYIRSLTATRNLTTTQNSDQVKKKRRDVEKGATDNINQEEKE